MNINFPEDLLDIIKNGGIGVIPTDTMYGVVGSALLPESVEKIYKIRERDPRKPLIVLISKMSDLYIFNPNIDETILKILENIWPNPVSVEIPVLDEKFSYLSRGVGHFGFRFPKNEKLLKFLEKTGPLVAPSVNIEGEKPAENLDEAWEYFPELDFYIDGGAMPNNPSTVVSIENGKLKVKRQGVWQVPQDLV